jgi:2,3-bisphosphoglycerate-independent phosphoglycerate mutase
VFKEKLADYAGGHLSDDEAAKLIRFIDEKLGSEAIRFYPGVSYRHLCVINNTALTRVDCTPPHDAVGDPIDEILPRGDGAQQLIDLMNSSFELLCAHKINRTRMVIGQNPSNMIWLWGQGTTPQMPPFKDKFGIGGGVISAVDLVKGIARILELEPINVPGVTGYYDTNYEGKAEYAIRCLEKDDFVLVHVEAPDEASHNADIQQKIMAIENFDRLIVGPVKKYLNEMENRILVMPDHATPIEIRTHTSDPVPFAWCGTGTERDRTETYSERTASDSALYLSEGYQLMEQFIRG